MITIGIAVVTLVALYWGWKMEGLDKTEIAIRQMETEFEEGKGEASDEIANYTETALFYTACYGFVLY